MKLFPPMAAESAPPIRVIYRHCTGSYPACQAGVSGFLWSKVHGLRSLIFNLVRTKSKTCHFNPIEYENIVRNYWMFREDLVGIDLFYHRTRTRPEAEKGDGSRMRNIRGSYFCLCPIGRSSPHLQAVSSSSSQFGCSVW